MRQETQASPVYLDNQVLKVSQGPQEALDVQGLMAPEEREGTRVSEASLDLKVSLDPEGTLEFQVSQGRVLMGPGVRMVSQGVLEPKASLGRCLELAVEFLERTVCQECLETRASLGHLEDLEDLVLMDVLVFLVEKARVELMVVPVFLAFLDFQVILTVALLVHLDLLAAED